MTIRAGTLTFIVIQVGLTPQSDGRDRPMISGDDEIVVKNTCFDHTLCRSCQKIDSPIGQLSYRHSSGVVRNQDSALAE